MQSAHSIYTQEGYDDFYYGKGSTFPDVQGAIGILFEQASSRGHAQESVNGVLRFPFTIRNQFTTALSTLTAVNALRVELLTYQRDFFKTAVSNAAKDPVKAVAFGSNDPVRATMLAEVIARHTIDVQKLSNQSINGKRYATTYGVSLNQAQYTLLKSMFEKRTQFKDSLFYDISSWTLPLAYGVDYEELKVGVSGEKITDFKIPTGKLVGGESEYAYVLEPGGYYVPRAMNRLLQHNIRVKVATEPFFHSTGKKFERGSIVIPVAGQEKSEESINYLIQQILTNDGLDVYAFNTGLDYQGVSLGSGSFSVVRKPEIAILVGDGVNSNDAGELWHLLDHRLHIPVTMLPVDGVNRINLSKYNTVIFPSGSYTSITESGKEKLKTWVQNGGVIIGFENALQWLNSSGLGKFEMKPGESTDKQSTPRPYALLDEYRGAQESPGAIFEASADLTHPLLYGYDQGKLAIFKSNNIFIEKSKNLYANPLTFGSTPLASGYISKQNYAQLKNASVAGVSAIGQGRIIGFTDNLCFRAFWLGTNKLFTNAIYYGPIISSGSAR